MTNPINPTRCASEPRTPYRRLSRRRGSLAAAARAAARSPIAQVEEMEDRRMLAAGDLDPTFGAGGSAASPFAGAEIFVTRGLDNRNGKTVVVGEASAQYEYSPAIWTASSLGIVRFDSSGRPDPTFSGDGRLTSNLLGGPGGNYSFTVTDVLIQPDNKILVTGSRKSDGRAALVRFNAGGSVDTSFGGGDGIVTFAFNRANAIGLAAGNKIYVGGGHVVYPADNNPDALPTTARFAAARLNPNGSFDTTFSGDGQIITTFTGEAYDVTVQGDSKLILAGPTNLGTRFRYNDLGGGVVRLSASGAYDTTFSGDGRFSLPAGSGVVQSAELARDGDIVVGAKGIAHEDNFLTPFRLNGNGTVERYYDAVMANEGYGITVNDTRVSFDGQKAVFFSERMYDSEELSGAIVRYDRDGTVDETFGGGDGITGSSLGAFGDFQSDHKIVAGDDIDLQGFGESSAQVRVERRLYDSTTPPPPPPPPPSGSVTLSSPADAYVRDGSHAGTNFGQSHWLEAKKVSAPGYSRESYLRFDLTGVSSADRISTAVLRLFGGKNDEGTGSMTVGVYAVNPGSWTENGLTWNNRPVGGTLLTTQTIFNFARTYSFDVSDYVRRQKAAGATSVAFAIRAPTVSEGWAAFYSDENPDVGTFNSHRPELVVGQT